MVWINPTLDRDCLGTAVSTETFFRKTPALLGELIGYEMYRKTCTHGKICFRKTPAILEELIGYEMYRKTSIHGNFCFRKSPALLEELIGYEMYRKTPTEEVIFWNDTLRPPFVLISNKIGNVLTTNMLVRKISWCNLFGFKMQPVGKS
jgi:hypothetical protein